MKQPVERRLAEIFAAEVAGYSRLMGAVEEGTHQRLKALRVSWSARRSRTTAAASSDRRGRHAGGIPSAVDAVRCAVEAQRAMLDRNADVPEDAAHCIPCRLQFRRLIIDGGDIYGDSVNIAARLESLAEPGGIGISLLHAAACSSIECGSGFGRAH
jgi:adenylate cyclase